MVTSLSGREARYITGQEAYSGSDGPYWQTQAYDVWGNTIQRNGWGGWNATEYSSYTNNRRNDLSYDAAGNLTWSGSTMTYDAMGQQASDVYSSFDIHNSYDGDRLRVKKLENTVTTYYLRSSVLGGQVIAELNGTGTFKRGYVYLGGQMVAMQENNQVKWVHQDPVVKSQRFTDSSGNVVSTIELDPWGGETSRSSTPSTETHRFTTYERDVNGRDQAMMRQLHSWFRKFDQPDPYDGSYDLANPQSFNRYAYVQNDPVNFSDPSGLLPNNCEIIDGQVVCYDSSNTFHVNTRGSRLADTLFVLNSRFGGYDSGRGNRNGGGTPQDPCFYPQSPPEVDMNANIREAESRRKQVEEALEVDMFNNGLPAMERALGATVALLSWFKSQVQLRGPWDYKNSPLRTPWEISTSFYESFGNFHFGVVGAAAGIRLDLLLRGAGRAQENSGDVKGEGKSGGLLGAITGIGAVAPYGDQYRDQLLIKKGYAYYTAGCHKK